jgi:hypothetical protein
MAMTTKKTPHKRIKALLQVVNLSCLLSKRLFPRFT